MEYRIKEMKQNTETMERKGYRHHAVAVLSVIAGMLVAVSLTAHGKDINPQKAAQIAKRYVTLSHNNSAKAQTRGINRTTEAPYYIFNDARGRGFVIVSGDDEMGEVLAYSTERTLDTLNANPCVKLLLEGYRQTFEVLKEGKVIVQGNTRAGQYSQTVSPLLKSKWGQSHPFNAKTGYPYSGCVATAVAQMMYYYQWPAQGRGKNEYNVTYYNTKKSADFSQSHYDWANMLPDYRYPVHATSAQEDAVALLMSDVGIASFMQYTPNASGTQGLFAYQALQKNFDYTAAYITRAVEGPSRFAEILRQELLNGCPVYLEGRPTGSASGHAWVADGFDKNGLFHMNFGWEGQSDAYYSLTALNLSQTGNEFQGKPLAFNRAITAILAHPNNGKYPAIERGLLETSPQLMFNEGGSFSLKDVTGKTFNPSQTITVEMNSFVNRGNPFKGDIGVAVYDEGGNLKQVAYSDDHASGGLTQRIYGADHAGFMGRDFLINQAQPVKISLAGLGNGYYRLIPVCVARKDDGSWDEFLPMKKAPIIEVELANGAARISETCTEDAHFQLMAQPRLSDKAEQGEKVQAVFTVKNLNGVPRDCYLRVQLLDASKTVVLNTRADKATEIEGFTEAEIPIVLSLPSGIAIGRYEVKLEISADEAETLPCPINNIHDKDAAYIDVVKAQERPLMEKAEVFLADDSNEKIASGSIDISRVPNFKLAVALRTSENRTYEGIVSMFCEDIQTKEKIKIRGFDDHVTISSSFEVPLYSYWLRKSNLQLADGHTYRVIVMGQIEGKDVELKNPKAPTCYLKRKGDILTLYHDVPTGIDTAPTATTSFDIRHDGNQLTVSGSDLRTLRLYNVGGTLVKQVSAMDGSYATISLQGLEQGVYLLRIEAGRQHRIYKFLHRPDTEALR
ncbi:putative thiol protease/hemagglutinin PrtT [Hoylesella marshii DSM 16973 = JCM 13450]|uniref:Thiol protease/hemagglutinin PrtT n=2 Tax=Hoylesella marshii TaxID=189722 RepID=E0NRB1_9BACT|nr:putative thiol protease/hemagglutinin PrtT [Hoylesella marshii DSM 16973 = JCM 13450]